jgi:hypothetical protein
MIRAPRVFAAAGVKIGEKGGEAVAGEAPDAYLKGARPRRQKWASTKNAKRSRRPVCFTVC